MCISMYLLKKLGASLQIYNVKKYFICTSRVEECRSMLLLPRHCVELFDIWACTRSRTANGTELVNHKPLCFYMNSLRLTFYQTQPCSRHFRYFYLFLLGIRSSLALTIYPFYLYSCKTNDYRILGISPLPLDAVDLHMNILYNLSICVKLRISI